MNLRPYQSKLDNARKSATERSVLIQCPTGGGKSLLIERAVADHQRVLILVHARWLLGQLAEHIPGQIISAGVQYDGSPIVIGMIQTIVRRDLPDFDAIVIDECHHCPSASYREVISRYPSAKIYGFSATPARLDGQGLGDIFDVMIAGPSYKDLIDGGWLKPFEVLSIPSDFNIEGAKIRAGDYAREDLNRAVRRSTIFGDAVDNYFRRCRHLGAHASFWPSIDTAMEAAERFRARGATCYALHSKLPENEITDLIRGLRAGTVESLATVGMLGEGLNLPGLSSVSCCRKTASLTVYLQQRGRANRGGEGTALILDHVADWQHHGLPDDDREWTLKGRVKRRAAPGTVAVWDCPECWVVNRSQQSMCSGCGAPKPRELVLMEERAAELERITSADTRDIHEHCEEPDDYLRFARAHGKRQTWAVLKWCERPTGAAGPFAAAAGTVRPTIREFVSAARMMGVNEDQARIAAKHIGLVRG